MVTGTNREHAGVASRLRHHVGKRLADRSGHVADEDLGHGVGELAFLGEDGGFAGGEQNLVGHGTLQRFEEGGRDSNLRWVPPLMRLLPVRPRSHLHQQRHGQTLDAFHDAVQFTLDCLDLDFGSLNHQFVMHLQNEPRPQPG